MVKFSGVLLAAALLFGCVTTSFSPHSSTSQGKPPLVGLALVAYEGDLEYLSGEFLGTLAVNTMMSKNVYANAQRAAAKLGGDAYYCRGKIFLCKLRSIDA